MKNFCRGPHKHHSNTKLGSYWSTHTSFQHKAGFLLVHTNIIPIQSWVPIGSEMLEEQVFEVSFNNNHELPMAAMYFCQIMTRWGNFVEGLKNIISVKFGSNWSSCFGDEQNLKC